MVIEEILRVDATLHLRNAKNSVQVVLQLNTGLEEIRSATSAWITQNGGHTLTLRIPIIHRTCLFGNESHQLRKTKCVFVRDGGVSNHWSNRTIHI